MSEKKLFKLAHEKRRGPAGVYGQAPTPGGGSRQGPG